MLRSSLQWKIITVSITATLLFVGGVSAYAATTLVQTDATYTTASPSNLTGGFNTLYSATSSTEVNGSGASADVRLASSSPWTTATVDSTGSVGLATSIALDTNGKAHISYQDSTNSNLVYATNVSGSWATTTVDSAGNVGDMTSIALDTNGKAYISYRYITSDDLRYATNVSGSWATTTVDSAGQVGLYTSIALDTNSKAHISYYNATSLDLIYATNASGSWATTTVDSAGNVGAYTSLALDTNGKAYISYFDTTNGNLNYATNASGSWATTTVDAGGTVGWSTSLDLDTNGKAHISYYDWTNANLVYATNVSGSWATTTVDSAGNVGNHTSIDVDTNGKAHISYYDTTNTNLAYATNVSGSWATTTVDSAGSVGTQGGIALDTNDKAYISYLDSTNLDLKYATNNTPSVYTTSGTYKSYVDGEAAAPSWSTFTATKSSTASGEGSVAFKIKTSSSSTTPPTFDASGAACDFSVSSDGSSGSKDLTSCTGLGTDRYLWYQATLTTADTSKSPLLQDVTVVISDATSAPTVTTQAASSVTQTTATANGNITATGSTDVTVRGFAYGTSASLATVIATTTDSAGQPFSTGAYTGSLSSLTCGTTYYVRAYATNSVGTALGSIETFATSACTPDDTTAPALTLNGSPSILVPYGNTYTDAGATATDDTDGDISANVITTGSVDTNTPGTYTLTYTVSDAALNAATPITRSVQVDGRRGGHSNKKKNEPAPTPSTPNPPASTPATPRVTPSAFTRNTFLGMQGDDVRALQQFLNAHGFPITATGPGSPGNETDLFGAFTKAALIRFQKANNITPAVGYFGPITRGIIASMH